MKAEFLEEEKRRFSSGRKATFIRHSRCWLMSFFLLLLGGVLLPQKALAEDAGLNKDQISIDVSKLQKEGYITIKFPHYDDHATHEWLNGKSGQTKSYIELDGVKILEMWSDKQDDLAERFYCKYEKIHANGFVFIYKYDKYGKDLGWTRITNGSTDESYPQHVKTGDVLLSSSIVKIYPDASELKRLNGSDVKIKLYVTTKKDKNTEVDAVSAHAKFDLPKAGTLTLQLSPNTMSMRMSLPNKAGDTYTYGSPTDGTKNIEGTFTGEDLVVDYGLSNAPQTPYFVYGHKLTDLQIITEQLSFVYDAYLMPATITAEQDTNTADVVLKWLIQSDNFDTDHQYIGPNSAWVIQRSESPDFDSPVKVAEVAIGKISKETEFTIVDPTSKNNLNGEFYYRIGRNDNRWNWASGSYRSTKIKIGNSHKAVSNPKATIENEKVIITWDWDDGKILSPDSKIVLLRTNEAKARQDVIEISDTTLIKNRRVEDVLPEHCDVYSYKIYIVPGYDAYKEQSPIDVESNRPLFTSEVGSFVGQLNASKGYHSDRVTLDWSTDGLPINLFVISARVHGSGDNFVQIAQMNVNVASTEFQYTDEKALPGVIYDYKVESVNVCGGNTIVGDTLFGIGFRTPTGDIYGRVTFENGQAEKGVEVRLEPADNTAQKGKSYYFTGNGSLSIENKKLLSQDKEFSLQAWIAPSADGTIIKKEGKFSLAVQNDSIVFTVGKSSVVAPKVASAYKYGENAFFHITAVCEADKLSLLINGRSVATQSVSMNVSTKDGLVSFGNGFAGLIDEVRLWNIALDSTSNAQTYNRYLVGNEEGLVGYYTFDYSLDKEFYDVSYSGVKYNGNHGTVLGSVSLKTDIMPTLDQLSYRNYTGEDGAYTIRAIPYIGNGTAYMIVPQKGIHSFESSKELRMISANAQSHTVNFVDKSSFAVSGTVVYSGGNYPSEGVGFTIDGIPAMNASGYPIKTDASGRFTIYVPVGKHEVKATKDGHVFELDGRICNSEGGDRDYQDIVTNVELFDSTKVRYIGRICGGTEQEAHKVGFSLSKNNLADNMTIKLSPTQSDKYALQTKSYVHSDTVPHLILKSTQLKVKNPNVNKTITDFNEQDIVIHVNNETGEFVADVLPINYTMSLSVYGHKGVTEKIHTLNLSEYKPVQYEMYEYKDSLFANGVDDKEGYDYYTFKDSVGYNAKQIFTQRYEPTIEVKQMSGSGHNLDYFGDAQYNWSSLDGTKTITPLYDEAEKSYTFGLPVFSTAKKYYFNYSIFEEYLYYTSDTKTDLKRSDRVYIDNADVTFDNGMKFSDEHDTLRKVYSFIVREPEDVSGKYTFNASFELEGSSKRIYWKNPLGNDSGEAFVFGSRQVGVNFVTGGPNKMLCVLRDPPGSNSYSYLENGSTFNQSSTYTGSISNEGSEIWTTGVNVKTNKIDIVGMPGAQTGVSFNLSETETGIDAGITHSEEYTGSNSKSTSVTLTTRIQTSSAPSFVGADGDIYVGYSTNISFGSTYYIHSVPMKYYEEVKGDTYFDKTYLKTNEWAIVKAKGVNAIENFGTLFVYPQSYIENRLIPNLIDLRKSLLIPKTDAKSSEEMQKMAISSKSNLYVSLVDEDDETFGEEGAYEVYYYYGTKDSIKCDTINYINQAIERWNKVMSDNDSIKVNAAKMHQNYSFNGGAAIEYSESYSSTLSSSHSFSIKLGAKIGNEFDCTTVGGKCKFEFEEEVSTTQGGEWSSEAEASHTIGFALEEDGDDFLSVDVLYEDADFDNSYVGEVGSGTSDTSKLKHKDFYPTFVFRTRGGATSCPYEGAYKAVHWKGHEDETINVATLRMEVPVIDMPQKSIENVPSGGKAYLKVYMKNASETDDDQWFNLRIVDELNPNGAIPEIDGNSMSGMPLDYFVRAGEVLEKTIAVSKGKVLNYDSLALVLSSKCESSIADTVYFSVHFIPSCSDVEIVKPSNNWTYNTNCDTITKEGVVHYYMPIKISGFDVNYADFERIELQYKAASQTERQWITLVSYYKSDSLATASASKGDNAMVIDPNDGGVITYNFFMDDLPDQEYDIRAVSYCKINNVDYENISEVVSGIKDVYRPRLFGTPKPADGVLTINDDIRIDFNEPIAEGKLANTNFEVKGVRNGAGLSHDVAIALDGENDYLATEVTRNLAHKNLTFECWVNFDEYQNATFFSHGGANAIEMGMNKSGNIVVKLNGSEYVSDAVPEWEKGSWNHIALTYNCAGNKVTAYVNYKTCVYVDQASTYEGNGVVEIGRSVSSQSGYFKGKVDQFRIWTAARSSATIQVNSEARFSGNDVGLLACYDMDEAKGNVTEDKARGAHMIMKGASWVLPEGRAASFNGEGYIAMNSAAAVTTSDMDLTLEFWFNAPAGAKNQTMLSSGDGMSNVGEDPAKVFSVGFNENGVLTFRHNGRDIEVNGDYADNNWHNFALTVSRSAGQARIYMDGALNTYDDLWVSRFSSDRIYAGARVWYKEANATERTADRYFKGMVDEVRLWNLYRQQSQIENSYNQKVTGEEMGLILYYPFEHYIIWQGTPEMQFTLKDMANKNIAPADSVGKGLKGIANIPPVKSKTDTVTLLYDWVVNNDALIINLLEPAHRIEKTIVSFTVKGIQDKNGNSIVSPIPWTAYIDRNQLKWQDDEVNITKKLYEETSFSATMSNNGGSIINYSLENMPSWLKATPSSGTISPKTNQSIEFTIDPSLNVGTYNEVVYLTTSDKVTEALTLNVKVEGDTPDWKVDPNLCEYSMSVFAQIKIDGQFSNDKEDMLAAFYQGKCVGVAHVSYNEAMDMWYAMLNVCSDKQGKHPLSFKLWDASTGTIYTTNAKAENGEDISFVNNKVYGSPSEPIVFANEAKKIQNIQLNKGWNWVSFNLENEDDMADFDKYLANAIWGSHSMVKNIRKSANYSVVNGSWVNSEVELNNTSMFKINSEIEQVLSVSGKVINPANYSIAIKKGWNYISYLPSSSMTLKSALAGYEAADGDLVKSVDGFAMHYGNEWVGSLTYMQPGCGYMLKSVTPAAKSFTYPTSSSALRSAYVADATASEYESNMNIVAYVPEREEGDVVSAVVEGKENKSVLVKLDDANSVEFISVAANEGAEVKFILERDGKKLVANNVMKFESDAVYGSPSAPVVLDFWGNAQPLMVNPNPVEDMMNIQGTVAQDGTANVELFDASGALIYTGKAVVANGMMNASFNVSHLPAGAYMLNVSIDDVVNTIKVLKK